MSYIRTSKNHTEGLFRILSRFFGSMNLAIILLVTIAIASIIGTVLRQNEPYQNYIIKFGPFWHQLYRNLGLYDVYSSIWFIAILAFLVISVSICVTRNAPQILQSMRRFRLDISEKALLNMPEKSTWSSTLEINILQNELTNYLQARHYRVKTAVSDNRVMLAAMKGASNRLGYLLTHLAIVIICIGGLLDGNLPLKLKTMSGKLTTAGGEVLPKDFSDTSKLPENNSSFRSSVSIPEGANIDYAFINIANGFLLQPLPFSIEVKDFRIDQYDNGQPKSFNSDLIIHDKKTKQAFEHTISVNHPLDYNGYTIYQASFGDGGSRLDITAHALQVPESITLDLEGIVDQQVEMNTPDGPVRIEFTDFRRYNISPVTNDVTRNEFIDHGPNFTFKIRRADGTAKEYLNYMYPVTIDNNDFFLSGVRSTPNEEFRYLHIPADPDFSIKRFFRFYTFLYNDEKVTDIITNSVFPENMDETKNADLKSALMQLIKLFRFGGLEAISRHIENYIPPDQHEKAAGVYMNLLQNTLRAIYIAILDEEGITEANISEADINFFDNAVRTFSGMYLYETPFYLELKDFEHRQATGLQITRTPGKQFVYLGFALLISGVFLLFYIAHQRLWITLTDNNSNRKIILAGTGTRHKKEFSREFAGIVELFNEKFSQSRDSDKV